MNYYQIFYGQISFESIDFPFLSSTIAVFFILDGTIKQPKSLTQEPSNPEKQKIELFLMQSPGFLLPLGIFPLTSTIEQARLQRSTSIRFSRSLLPDLPPKTQAFSSLTTEICPHLLKSSPDLKLTYFHSRYFTFPLAKNSLKSMEMLSFRLSYFPEQPPTTNTLLLWRKDDENFLPLIAYPELFVFTSVQVCPRRSKSQVSSRSCRNSPPVISRQSQIIYAQWYDLCQGEGTVTSKSILLQVTVSISNSQMVFSFSLLSVPPPKRISEWFLAQQLSVKLEQGGGTSPFCSILSMPMEVTSRIHRSLTFFTFVAPEEVNLIPDGQSSVAPARTRPFLLRVSLY